MQLIAMMICSIKRLFLRRRDLYRATRGGGGGWGGPVEGGIKGSLLKGIS
jgi:hypothetical protein